MPRPGDQAPATGSEPLAAAPAGTHTVLVVEDDELVRSIAQRALTRAGYQVLAAADAATALALLADRPDAIDAVISDAVMPHAGGRELTAGLRRRWPGLPVLLMSGHAPDADPCTGGHAAFLQKPFTGTELVDATARLIAAHPRQRAAPTAQPDLPVA
ncbi:MAG: response regulator [Planctomycetota bacterium]